MNPRHLPILLIALLGSSLAQAEIFLFDDGLVHVVFDDAYASGSIKVEDNLAGPASTTVNLFSGTIGRHIQQNEQEPVSVDWSILARATYGEHANVNMFGGSTVASIEARDGSCILIDGSSVGADSEKLSAVLHSETEGYTARLRFLSGSLEGMIEARGGARLTVESGTVGAGPVGYSLLASGSNRSTFVDVTGGTFDRAIRGEAGATLNLAPDSVGTHHAGSSVSVGSGSVAYVTGGSYSGAVTASGRVEILGGTFGAGVGPEYSLGAVGNGIGRASGGTFGGAIVARHGGQIGITGGSFGVSTPGLTPSITAVSLYGPSSVYVSNGSFLGGISAERGGRIRIAGGTFGSLSSITGGDSLAAFSYIALSPAEIQVFGGSFANGFRVGPEGTIHVYGTGLTKSLGNMFSGTLQDGTPIALDYMEIGNGKLILHDALEITSIHEIDFQLEIMHELLFQLPDSLIPLVPNCQGGFELAPKGAFEIAKQGGMFTFSITEEVTNPGEPEYQASVPVELVALELESVDPIDVGGVTEKLFITLQSNRGLSADDPAPGPASTGTLSVDFGMRTFTLEFEIFYDIREGGPDGSILVSGSDSVSSPEPAPWTPTVPGSALGILPAGSFFPGAIAGAPWAFKLVGSDFEFYVQTPAAEFAIEQVPALGTPGVVVLIAMLTLVGVAVGARHFRRGVI